jgi:hypothetical protein
MPRPDQPIAIGLVHVDPSLPSLGSIPSLLIIVWRSAIIRIGNFPQTPLTLALSSVAGGAVRHYPEPATQHLPTCFLHADGHPRLGFPKTLYSRVWGRQNWPMQGSFQNGACSDSRCRKLFIVESLPI